MRHPPPVCASGPRWIANRLHDRHALAPLTGQDRAALHAFLHLVELYAFGDGAGRRHAIAAMREVVLAMQPSCRHLAKVAIPHVLDWKDEDEIWSKLHLEASASA